MPQVDESVEARAKVAPTAELIASAEELLTDLNIGTRHLLRNAGPEATDIVRQMGNKLYPILILVREVKARHKKANPGG